MLGTVAVSVFAHAALAADCSVLDALDNFPTTGVAPKGTTCVTYLTERSEIGVSCHWAHAFRDVSATTFANRLWSQIKSCRPGAPLGPDTRVNHPDSYELLQWADGRAVYSVSIKDKGALDRTLVFVRRAPSADP